MRFDFLVKANKESAKLAPSQLHSHLLTRTGYSISNCQVTQDPEDVYGYSVAIEVDLLLSNIQDLIKGFHSNQQDFDIIAYVDPLTSPKPQYIVCEMEFEENFITNLLLFEDNFPETTDDDERDLFLKMESKKGDFLFKKGKYEEAVIAYKNAMNLHLRKNNGQQNDPVVCEYLYKIGKCYIGLCQYHRSSNILQKAILTLNIIEPDSLEKRSDYIETLVKSLISQGDYHNARQNLTTLVKLYNQIIEKDPKTKNELTIKILKAEEKLHYCNMQLTDHVWYGIPNPYGRKDYFAPDPKEFRQSQVLFYKCGMTVIKNKPNGEREEFDSYEIMSSMKPPDLVKLPQALKDAVRAIQLGQNLKFERILMAFPVEIRKKIHDHVRKSGFARFMQAMPSTTESGLLVMRPFTLHNSFIYDPHLTQRGPDRPKDTHRPR